MSIPPPPAGDPALRETAAAFPARVGRYQLVGLLGAGGAATVHLGRATGIGGFSRNVAVKLLHAHLHADVDFVNDFLREARLAARLRHPNVLPVLDVGDADGSVYLVMDWVDGASLAQLIEQMHKDKTMLPVPIALRIITDALSGLHAAHEMLDDDGRLLGLVHRDVSPQNLLLAATGNVLLADFGIAKPTEQPGHTRAGVIKGKLPYMAPEQLRASLIDRRVDVWAAGIICWELLAGARAFAETDQAGLIQKVFAGQVQPLRLLRPELPAALHDAVDRALAPDSDERWSNADMFRSQLVEAAKQCGGLAESAEVGALLLSVLGDAIEARRDLARTGTSTPAPTPAADPEPPQPATPPTLGKRSGLRLAWGVPVVLAAIAVVFLWMSRQPERTQPPLPEAPVARPLPLPVGKTLKPQVDPARQPPLVRQNFKRPAVPSGTTVRDKTSPQASPEPPLADDPYK